MDPSTILWITGIILVITGIAGSILPVLPGPVLIYAGLILAAWANSFAEVSLWVLAFLGLLTGIAYLLDFLASVVGVQKTGASNWAVAGATVGALIGIFFGLPGIILGPFIGAVGAEFLVKKDLQQAGLAGAGAWIGMVVGAVVKVAVIFTMLGVFTLAYLF